MNVRIVKARFIRTDDGNVIIAKSKRAMNNKLARPFLKLTLPFIILIFIFSCSDEPLGEHGFTRMDFENEWFSVKFKYIDGNTKTVGLFKGIGECNAYGEGYMSAQEKYAEKEDVQDYVCCFKVKDPYCKYEFR